MRLQDFLNSAAGISGMDYQGSRGGELHGFSLPGTRTEAERFFVLVDESWPYHQRIKASQNDWSNERLAEFIRSRSLRRLLVPRSMGEEPFGPDKDYMYVDGTYRFLAETGLAGRERAAQVGNAVVGVTGSAGKSTFKAMLEHAYRAVRPQASVLAPPPHFNTYIRVLSELIRSPDYDLSILELSAGGRGAFFNESIREETSVSPDVAVITNISHAHTRVMKNLRGVVNQKSAILTAPKPGGAAVLNADTLRAQKLRERAIREGWHLADFGEAEGAAFRLHSYTPAERRVRATTPAGEIDYQLGAEGRHMAYNSLGVLATLWSLGITELEEAAASLSAFTALPGRGETHALPLLGGGQATVIDETYNANPSSMRAALEGLSGRPAGAGRGRRIAVLADMLMLGDQELKLHRQLLEDCREVGIDRFYLHGDLMLQALGDCEDTERFIHVEEREGLASILKSELQHGDLVVFKGSNSMGLDQVIEALATAGLKR